MGGRIAIDTLGCKLNQAESESMAWHLRAAGYQVTHFPDAADAYILNTCTVTHVADRKCRHLLRMARRRSPGSLIVAAGCYAQRAREEVERIESVDVVLDNEEKRQIVEALQDRGMIGGGGEHVAPPLLRTRSMVKIQEGCDRFCAYCIVPFVRGRERSVSPDKVIAEIEHRVSNGYREVTLTGTEIGAYKPSLESLVRGVLAETGIERLRLSSLRPQDLTPQLLALWNDDRLCPHLHVPLQSGSDAVLGMMNRDYSSADYADTVSLVRKAVPHVAITTDIIVGFPGETAEDFEAGHRFCRSMGFAGIHAFPYSERPGTAAASLPSKVPAKEKAARMSMMLEIAENASRDYRQRFVGSHMMVLWEQQVKDGLWAGLTQNYIRVYARTSHRLGNSITPVVLTGWHNGHLLATPVVPSSEGG